VEPGRRIGDYELVRRIGSGGMAEVWMGRRAVVGGATKAVAIKFISPRVAGSERHHEMFLEEARLSMMMSHSNVVQVFDAGRDGEHMYMVMEWVDGINLAQLFELIRAADARLSPTVVGYVFGEMLKGLGYAHNLHHEGQQVGIVHRDISPHNVLVSVSGEVKIADFGVARLSTEETAGVHIKGKLRYMAPEHLAGRSKSPKVDLFGAGAVLHELLTGQKFRGDVDEARLYALILGGELAPLPAGIDVPPELEALRAGLLEPDENARIESADVALQLLEQWAGYRSTSGELGRICRMFMGVDAPRSGIQGGSSRTDGSVPPDAAVAATNTWSSAQVARDATHPGGRAGTSPGFAAHDFAPERRSRVGLLVACIAAGGIALGGLGFALMRRTSADDPQVAVVERAADEAAEQDPAEGASPQLAALPEPSGPIIPVADAQPSTDEDEADEVAEPVEDQDSVAPSEPEDASEREVVAPTRTPRAKTAPTPKATAPAKVIFRLKSPLRFAFVRIDGGRAISLEPSATQTVKPGKHTIDWRVSEDRPWVRGGTFDLASGRTYTIRVSNSGPALE
jgi:serine/threonine protein kinase